MTNPSQAAISGYASKEEALAAWANIVDNDQIAVCSVVIGLASFNPADKPVCWILLPKKLLELE